MIVSFNSFCSRLVCIIFVATNPRAKAKAPIPLAAKAPDKPRTAIFKAPTLTANAETAAPAKGAAVVIAEIPPAIAANNKVAFPASVLINSVSFVINPVRAFVTSITTGFS